MWPHNVSHSIEADDEMGTLNGVGDSTPCRTYFLRNCYVSMARSARLERIRNDGYSVGFAPGD
jgi:hypothetical protein